MPERKICVHVGMEAQLDYPCIYIPEGEGSGAYYGLSGELEQRFTFTNKTLTVSPGFIVDSEARRKYDA